MIFPALILLTLLGFALAGALFQLAASILRLRGRRLVTCPETKQPVGVTVATGQSVLSATFGQPHLRLKDCTRWPLRQDCDQACVTQIEEAPADCLVANILRTWYRGKVCRMCGRAIGDIEMWDHKPALVDPEGRTWGWHEIPVETLPTVLASDAPICWDCHVAATLYRLHPDLIVERPEGWQKLGSLYH
jgi:hypothetical protein